MNGFKIVQPQFFFYYFEPNCSSLRTDIATILALIG